MSRLNIWAFVPVLFAIASCSPASGPAVAVAPPITAPAPVNPADAAFAMNAATDGIFAKQLSELAVQQGSRQGIRDFAQTVVDQQTQSAGDLAAIAKAKGLKLPDMTTPAQAKTVKTLSTTPTGPAFARSYFSTLVRSQRAALQRMQVYAKTGSDPELRAFAASQVSMLQKQLAAARQVPRQRG